LTPIALHTSPPVPAAETPPRAEPAPAAEPARLAAMEKILPPGKIPATAQERIPASAPAPEEISAPVPPKIPAPEEIPAPASAPEKIPALAKIPAVTGAPAGTASGAAALASAGGDGQQVPAGWETPRYADSSISLAQAIAYSGELFDDIPGNDNLRKTNSDGDILLTRTGYNRTVLVVNQYKFGSISGMKFEDMNGNGQKDTGEKGLAGWTITLTGEGVGLTAMTESNGAYVFNNLIPANYQVCEVSQSGWENTTGDKCQEVTVTAGTETKDVNFGNFQLGKVQGYKFYDKDDDGVWDADEKGIENWQICLTKGEDKKCQLTNETGYYKFENLAAGDYVLSEENRDGWRQSFPEKGTYTVSINSGTGIGESAPAYNFGNAPPAGLILSKTNSNLTAHPGDLVTYTLTIQVGQRTLSEMHLMDVLPEGFLYQTGTAKVDDQSLEPVITGNGKILTWNWTKPVEGESTVVVNYEVKIADSNQPSAYNNLAYVWGKGSPEVVSNIADSEVKIEPVVSHSEKVGGVGQVLGASTELPATGSNTELLIAALTLLLSGIILRFKIKKESLK